MRSFAALALFAFAGLSTAQDQYEIDPEKVTTSLREYWCKQQKSQCPLICLQQPGVESQNTIANDCNSETLAYSCVCEDNSTPNITEYTQTMPYFKCTEWGNQCVKDCGNGNAACADKCRSDHPCGAQDPVKPNATASASPSKTPGASETESDGRPAATQRLGDDSGDDENGDASGSTGGAVALGAGYGSVVVTFAGIFAAFAFL